MRAMIYRLLTGVCALTTALAAVEPSKASLEQEFDLQVRPLVKQFCLECH